MKSGLFAGAFCAGALLLAGPAAAVQYVITDLGDLGGSQRTSRANAVNELGQVVGYSFDAAGWSRPVVWSASGQIQAIATFGGAAFTGHGQATGINDLGQVVGYNQQGANFNEHAFVWDGSGAMDDLGVLAGRGTETRATGINNDGLVVGYAPGQGAGFTWTSGALQLLTGTGGAAAIPFAVNEDGVMAGRGGGGASDSFTGVAGATQDLGALGGDYTVPYAINKSGQVAGVSQTANFGDSAFLWTGGAMQNLGGLTGAYGSTAYGINDAGDVVGQSLGANDRAVLWSGGAIYDLNDFVTGSGWTLIEAKDINNKGQIVGSGVKDGKLHAFLLTRVEETAVPEPATWAVLLLGFALVGTALRSRRRGLA